MMGTTVYEPRTTDAAVEAAFTNKKVDIDPETQATLDCIAERMKDERIIALTQTLEEFLENTAYNGYGCREVVLQVDNTTTKASLLILHEPNLLTRLVFVDSEKFGRTYGSLDPKNNFTLMSLTDIFSEHGDLALRNMATMLILCQHLDGMESK